MLNHIVYIYQRLLKKKKERYIRSLVKKGLKLGHNVEIIADFFFDPSHCFLISIGNNCTICPNVRLVAHDASTKKTLGFTKIGKITIEENCFIGDSVIILPGVRIGAGTIVGAGSIVTKDIPSDKLACGNPARVICSVKDYIEKYRSLSERGKVFSEEYLINRITKQRRLEVCNEADKGITFII